MTALETWLKRATCQLSAASAAQVRTEIQEHYESAREVALTGGATAEEADYAAVASLGDAKTANRQYRRVLLTTAEAKMLRDAKWEARAVCSRPWLKVLLGVLPAAALGTAAVAFVLGETSVARLILAVALGMCLLSAAVFLPINTPFRGRVFRCARWAWLLAFLTVASSDFLQMSWLLPACMWPIFWIEWTMFSIRRKLPVAEWPKQLYL